ncbi:STAS domain-containing protein [Nonomuraea ceibae]|uniref:STAS domain-containing protein n=1 Tax=Nonomuraea ceibae TaxID=1935170 RepID=UPI001C5E6F9D|nr:STAS domain-containing protein [Nonomuraea ceibae]
MSDTHTDTDAVRFVPATDSGRTDLCVLAVVGNLEYASAEQVRADLQQLVQSDHRHLILDLTRLDFLDSTGISILLAARSRIVKGDGVFALCGVNERAARIFKITALDQIIPLHPTLDQALQSLPAPSP